MKSERYGRAGPATFQYMRSTLARGFDMPEIPLDGFEFCCTVQPSLDMLDFNGHVTAVHFVGLFEQGTRAILSRLGFGDAYGERTGCGLCLAEAHLHFSREVFEGDDLDIYLRLVDTTETGVHAASVMINRSYDDLAASQEALYWHRDLARQTVVAMDSADASRLGRLKAEHDKCPPVVELGRRIGLRRRSDR